MVISKEGYCDDKNDVDSDGCTKCVVDGGWSCTPGSLEKESECSEICGDGKKMVDDVDK